MRWQEVVRLWLDVFAFSDIHVEICTLESTVFTQYPRKKFLSSMLKMRPNGIAKNSISMTKILKRISQKIQNLANNPVMNNSFYSVKKSSTADISNNNCYMNQKN